MPAKVNAEPPGPLPPGKPGSPQPPQPPSQQQPPKPPIPLRRKPQRKTQVLRKIQEKLRGTQETKQAGEPRGSQATDIGTKKLGGGGPGEPGKPTQSGGFWREPGIIPPDANPYQPPEPPSKQEPKQPPPTGGMWKEPGILPPEPPGKPGKPGKLEPPTGSIDVNPPDVLEKKIKDIATGRSGPRKPETALEKVVPGAGRGRAKVIYLGGARLKGLRLAKHSPHEALEAAEYIFEALGGKKKKKPPKPPEPPERKEKESGGKEEGSKGSESDTGQGTGGGEKGSKGGGSGGGAGGGSGSGSGGGSGGGSEGGGGPEPPGKWRDKWIPTTPKLPEDLLAGKPKAKAGVEKAIDKIIEDVLGSPLGSKPSKQKAKTKTGSTGTGRRAGGGAGSPSPGGLFPEKIESLSKKGYKVIQLIPGEDFVALFWSAGKGLPGTGPILTGKRVKVEGMTPKEFTSKFYEKAREMGIQSMALFPSRLVMTESQFNKILGELGVKIKGLPDIW